MLAALCGLAALGGHLFPIYLGFRGGKGVATGAGIVFGFNAAAGLAALAVFGLAFLAFRYVSLGSMLAALSLPAAHAVTSGRFTRWDRTEGWIVGILFALMGVAVIVRHRGNLARLRRGEEPRFGGTRA